MRHDDPRGARTRYEAEGEDALREIAHAKLQRDWPDASIAAHRDALAARLPEARDRVLTRERPCPVAQSCAGLTGRSTDAGPETRRHGAGEPRAARRALGAPWRRLTPTGRSQRVPVWPADRRAVE